VGMKVVITPTESGSMARWVSKLRPRQLILALSRHVSTVRRLNLCWGVHPILVLGWKDTDEKLERSKRMPKELGMASKGEKMVIIARVPISIPGTTNLIKVEIAEWPNLQNFMKLTAYHAIGREEYARVKILPSKT